MKRSRWILALLLFRCAAAEDPHSPLDRSLEQKIIKSSQIPDFSYDHRFSFGFGRLEFESGGVLYERVKIDAMYVGIGMADFFSHDPAFEAMGGYNFRLSLKDRLTPVAGISYLSGDVILPLVGVLYEHQASQLFRVGVNIKSLISKDFIYTAGIPLIFSFGPDKHWEAEFQPYLVHQGRLHLGFASTGLQCCLAYRF